MQALKFVAAKNFDHGERDADGVRLIWQKGQEYTGPNAEELLAKGLIEQVASEGAAPVIAAPETIEEILDMVSAEQPKSKIEVIHQKKPKKNRAK